VDTDTVSLNEARQNALDALNDIVCFGQPRDAIKAAEVLLSNYNTWPDPQSAAIVDADDTLFIPCPCHFCGQIANIHQWMAQ
jgi:hypothetical protein